MPNSINGQMKIVNFEYLQEYDNHDGQLYKALTRELEEGIKEAIGQSDVAVKVLNLT